MHNNMLIGSKLWHDGALQYHIEDSPYPFLSYYFQSQSNSVMLALHPFYTSLISPIFSLSFLPPKQKDLLLHIIITGAGAYAGCAYCTMLGEYSSTLGKMVYLKHRSFLPASDELRSTNSGYPNRRDSKA